MKQMSLNQTHYLYRAIQVTFFVLILISIINSSSSQAQSKQDLRNQTVIRGVMKEILSGAHKAVMESPLPVNEREKVLKNLTQLHRGVDQVRYQYSMAQLTPGGWSNCISNMDAQWVTKYDNPLGNYPMVVWRGTNEVSNFTPQKWRMLLHETISSLGVVDDEYMPSSATLNLFSSATQGTDPSVNDVVALKNIKMRKSAPVFSLGAEELCYGKNGGLLEYNGGDSGNTTGVGGGGGEGPMHFKGSLIQTAEAWWRKRVGPSQGAQFKKFLSIVSELGVEPLETHPNLIMTFPVQMEFISSKRTQKLTVRLMDRVLNSDEYHGSAINTILDHLNKFVLPAKSKKEANRHTVYGSELAERRGLIKKGSWVNYPHGQMFRAKK